VSFVNSLESSPTLIICPYNTVIIKEHGITFKNFDFQLPPTLPDVMLVLVHFDYGSMLGVGRGQWNHSSLIKIDTRLHTFTKFDATPVNSATIP
jgi:hypothetical protein